MNEVVKLGYVPQGIDDMMDYYGDPDPCGSEEVSHDFYEQQLQWFPLPDHVQMVLSWRPEVTVRSIFAHKRVGDAMVDALSAIWRVFGPKYLEEENLNRYGGVYNFRRKTGGEDLSTHSWGIAIDLNPHVWRYGKYLNEVARENAWHVFNMAFNARGFITGNQFSPPDLMHWQAALFY